MLNDQQRKICCYCVRSKTAIPTNSRKYVKEIRDFIVVANVNFHRRNYIGLNKPVPYSNDVTFHASVPCPM